MRNVHTSRFQRPDRSRRGLLRIEIRRARENLVLRMRMRERQTIGSVHAGALIREIFAACSAVHYVAVLTAGYVVSEQRDGVAHASAARSDFYEEVLVNPTLLTLLRQRGDLDCGGFRHVVVAYGNFFQLVRPLADGHLSVCVEPSADPLAVQEIIDRVLQKRGLTR